MKLEIISFIFGAILLLVGILGGGFEVRELKIPKVSWMPRMLSAVVGMAFIILGLGSAENSMPNTNGPVNPAQPQTDIAGFNNPGPPVVPANTNCDFTISDQLTEDAVSEQLTIMIDGKFAGTLTANEQYPNSVININVERPGKYSYTVEGSITAYDDFGALIAYSCTGQGMINVLPNKHFALAASISGNTILITIVEEIN